MTKATGKLPDTASLPSGMVKRCVCGRAWSADAWRELPYVGIQEFEDAPRLELRQCDKCGSTLALRIDR